MIARLFAALLSMYPRPFKDEFGDEMRTVFAEVVADRSGFWASARVFLRELRDLPGALSTIYLTALLKGEKMSNQNDYISPLTKLQALIGTLPFLAMGIAILMGKVDHNLPIRGNEVEIGVYILVLVGLLIGWVRGFPLWSYSFLGWSILLAYFYSNIRINGHWQNWIWIPFGSTVLIAILWTRSFKPILKLFRDVWNDWTRLSLAMFTLAGYAWMIYDEVHHPQLVWFILAATLAISASVWFFLRSVSLKGRIFSIIGGFLAGDIVSRICYATWDYRAYYGLPEVAQTWYQPISVFLKIFIFYLVILFWPALIAAIRRILLKPGME